MKTRLSLTAIAGAVGVAAGAFGAHALKDILTASGMLSTWNTAVLYNLIHASVLLAACLYIDAKPSATLWLKRACTQWLLGIALFSGSLYGLSLTGARWLGPITPIGGLFLITGWLCVLVQARKTPLSGESPS